MNIFEIRKNFANNLISLRVTNSLTQSQLAEKINYTDKAISKWERGESVPDISGLSSIAECFGVTVDWLITSHNADDVPGAVVEENKRNSKNHLWISILSAIGVLFVATLTFIILFWLKVPHSWITYLWVIPFGSIVLLVFNAIWGKYDLNFLFISLIIWSTVLAFYVSYSIAARSWSMWPVNLLIIPLQTAVFFWYKIR